MRIAICDDSLLELENTKKLVSSYYQKVQVNVDISCFDNPANLIRLIKLIVIIKRSIPNEIPMILIFFCFFFMLFILSIHLYSTSLTILLLLFKISS